MGNPRNKNKELGKSEPKKPNQKCINMAFVVSNWVLFLLPTGEFAECGPRLST